MNLGRSQELYSARKSSPCYPGDVTSDSKIPQNSISYQNETVHVRTVKCQASSNNFFFKKNLKFEIQQWCQMPETESGIGNENNSRSLQEDKHHTFEVTTEGMIDGHGCRMLEFIQSLQGGSIF